MHPCTALIKLFSKLPYLRNQVKPKNFTPQVYGASFDLIDLEDNSEYFCMCIPKKVSDNYVFTMHEKLDYCFLKDSMESIELEKPDNRLGRYL